MSERCAVITTVTGPGAKLFDLLLTRDPQRRPMLTLCLLAGCIYIGWMAVVWLYLIPHDVIKRSLGLSFLAPLLVPLLVIYPLVRSGLTRRWSDPGLALLQITWASATVVLGYATTPSLRPALLQTLVLIQVFGFTSLRPRTALLSGLGMIGMLLVMLGVMSLHPPPDFDPVSQTLRIVPTCFVLAVLTWQSRNFGRSRERLMQTRKALIEMAAQVQELATRDALTGLFNRLHAQERLELECERAARSGSSFSVALLDLDHFKSINDTLGHQAGDDVLCGFAMHARHILRDTDVIGRWGGEEFVMLLPGTPANQVDAACLNRLRQVLSHACLSELDPELRLSFSAGVAQWRPSDSPESLLHRADTALYEAKHGGRDRTRIAT